MSESGKGSSETQRKEVLLKIGELCMAWASLDHALDAALAAALGCTKDQVRSIATQIEPVSSRTKLMRLLIHTTAHEAGWIDMVCELLNRTDNVSARRNRIIHDAWDFKGEVPQQIDKRAKIKKPKAFAPNIISTEVRQTSSARQIQEVTLEASTCAVGLFLVASELKDAGESWRPQAESSALRFLDQAASLARQQAQQGDGT